MNLKPGVLVQRGTKQLQRSVNVFNAYSDTICLDLAQFSVSDIVNVTS